MLVNVSYNNKDITRKVDALVGKPFTIRERFQMNGIGSPRLVIAEASIQINNLLLLDNNRNYCNIEMRPKGIILGFRSLLESYALIIPYYKLVVYKGNSNSYSIHIDAYSVKIETQQNAKVIQIFMTKMLAAKAENLPTRLEDL